MLKTKKDKKGDRLIDKIMGTIPIINFIWQDAKKAKEAKDCFCVLLLLILVLLTSVGYILLFLLLILYPQLFIPIGLIIALYMLL